MSTRLNMLGEYGDWAASRAEAGPGPLSLRNPRWTSVDEWRKSARAELARSLCRPTADGGRDAGVMDVAVQGARERDGLSIEEISWQLPWGPRTEAVFIKPKGATGRLPGILALHDHAGNKYFGKRKITCAALPIHPMMEQHRALYYGGVAWADEIARKGFAVLVHDTFPFESRRVIASDLPPHAVKRMMSDPENVREVTPDDLRSTDPVRRYDVPANEPDAAIDAYNAFGEQHENLVAKSLFSAGTTWPGVVLAEDMAALSYLASRPDVDPARLGCGGLSGGGMRTAFLAGTDDRIRCAFSAGFMTTWSDFCRNVSYTHTWMVYAPGIPGLLDFPEILGLRAPLPSLVLATTEDPLFTLTETERAGRILAEVYAKAGAAGAFRISVFPGPHKFDLSMQTEAFAWLEKWLG
jgi:dienelactone hydrolase